MNIRSSSTENIEYFGSCVRIPISLLLPGILAKGTRAFIFLYRSVTGAKATGGDTSVRFGAGRTGVDDSFPCRKRRKKFAGNDGTRDYTPTGLYWSWWRSWMAIATPKQT